MTRGTLSGEANFPTTATATTTMKTDHTAQTANECGAPGSHSGTIGEERQKEREDLLPRDCLSDFGRGRVASDNWCVGGAGVPKSKQQLPSPDWKVR